MHIFNFYSQTLIISMVIHMFSSGILTIEVLFAKIGSQFHQHGVSFDFRFSLFFFAFTT